jgi:hypothetical protein
VKPIRFEALAASSCAALSILLLSGCSSQTASLAGGSALETDPLDPFGWSTRVDQESKGDLGPMVATCQQESDLVDQFQDFAQPCRLIAQGLTLKFDRYYLDRDKRVVAISGMHPDLDTYERLKGLMKDQSGVAQYADVCVRLGNNSLPELTVTSKDHCEQLNLGLL